MRRDGLGCTKKPCSMRHHEEKFRGMGTVRTKGWGWTLTPLPLPRTS